jgi:hypothetical protein
MKTLKTLHEWPLSKVELVEIDKKRYILKTIHKDFSSEVYRQKILRKKCRHIKIPEIYWTKKSNGKTSFLMEYIPHKPGKLSKKTRLEIIEGFHQCSRLVKGRHFPSYNFKAFYKDFCKAKKYLVSPLKNKSKKEIRKYFESVFDSDYSIVHGDWGHDQILGKDKKYYIVDFGKSFRGPSILDRTDLLKPNTEINIKAKIVNLIIDIAWLDLCKRKYIDYSYKKEFRTRSGEIRKLENKLE